MGEALYQRIRDEVSDHPVAYSGGVAGGISELQRRFTDIGLYPNYLNPLELDHLVMHPTFNVFLGYASDKTLEYAADHPSLTQKVLFSGAVLAGFTLVKEYGIDGTADYMDMVGNVFGWGFYRGSDYGWNNLKNDSQELGQQLYNTIKS